MGNATPGFRKSTKEWNFAFSTTGNGIPLSFKNSRSRTFIINDSEFWNIDWVFQKKSNIYSYLNILHIFHFWIRKIWNKNDDERAHQQRRVREEERNIEYRESIGRMRTHTLAVSQPEKLSFRCTLSHAAQRVCLGLSLLCNLSLISARVTEFQFFTYSRVFS